MAIIPFPVLCKCRKVVKRTKATKIKCKDYETGAEQRQNQNCIVTAGGDIMDLVDVASLLVMEILPRFWCGSLLYHENDDFRSSLTTWLTHSSKRRSLRWTSLKRQIMEVIEVDHVEETNKAGP